MLANLNSSEEIKNSSEESDETSEESNDKSEEFASFLRGISRFPPRKSDKPEKLSRWAKTIRHPPAPQKRDLSTSVKSKQIKSGTISSGER